MIESSEGRERVLLKIPHQADADEEMIRVCAGEIVLQSILLPPKNDIPIPNDYIDSISNKLKIHRTEVVKILDCSINPEETKELISEAWNF